MTITITGGKYASAAVSSVGTTTVTVSTTPFVSGDFAVARRVDLFPPPPAEFVTNGAFSSDTSWTKGAGVTISGGACNCTNAAFIVSQNVTLTPGTTYRMTFNYTMSSGSAMRVSNSLSDGANIVKLQSLVSNGGFDFTFVAVGNGITIGADSAVFSGMIDTIKITDVLSGLELKGTAFVRAFNTTSQLQLESEFFNPKTGAAVTQAVGDTILVSKTWQDVATSGIAVSNNVVTVSDTLIFGASGEADSVAFHDEGLTVLNTVSAAYATHYTIGGGFVSFGHLQDFGSKKWYGGVSFIFANASVANAFVPGSTSARLCMFGGSHVGAGTAPLYFASGYYSAGAPMTSDWAHLYALDVQFDATDVLSKSAGSNWTTPANHSLENCSFVGAGTNQIMIRFANGVVSGGQFKFKNNSAAPISVFGADVEGTYAIGAPAGKRSIILDVAQNALWRSDAGYVQTINCTNLISTNYQAGVSGSPELAQNANATKNIYFTDNYTNLRDGSALASIKDSDWSVDDSGTASGSASTLALRVFHSTGAGHSLGAQRGPWTYRIRKYGYDEIEGAIAESAYSLGTAGTAFNVAFGGAVNQISRPSLGIAVATALAYTGITATDHGASPVTWNSKSWSITVAVDLATYPTRTAAQLFAHIKAGIAQTAAWNGKAGPLWHVLMEEDGAGYISQRGKSGGAGAALKGVRIVDQAGNPLPGITYMVADDGTTYTPPVAVVLTVSANISLSGAEIRIYDLDNSPAGSLGTELGGTESCGDATFPYTGAAGNTLWIQIMAPGYEEFGQSVVMPAASAGFVATLRPDAAA